MKVWIQDMTLMEHIRAKGFRSEDMAGIGTRFLSGVLYEVLTDRFIGIGIYDGALWVKEGLLPDGCLNYVAVGADGKVHEVKQWLLEEWVRDGDLCRVVVPGEVLSCELFMVTKN